MKTRTAQLIMSFQKQLLFLASFTILSMSTSVQAGPKDFAIYVTRLGGDSESAKPYLAKFTAYLEEAMGWPKGSGRGTFFTDKQEATRFIQRTQPGLVVLEPQLYFELRKPEKLSPVAELNSKELVSSTFQLVTKDPAITSLEQLRGKKFWTLLADSPRYLSRVVFAGKIEVTRHFSKLKRIGQALKGVRAVLRGDAEATLLDDDQLAQAKKMEGGAQLKTVFTSPTLPPITVTLRAHSYPPRDEKLLITTLLKMCTHPKGADICKDMCIRKFAPVQARLFQEAQKRYDQP